jgi:hypothetical protein
MPKPTGVIVAEAQQNASTNHQGNRANGRGGAAAATATADSQNDAVLNSQALVP